ncbi:hypothetical protein KDW_64250 [Dictyobacter vulcani]|uniref:DUF2336 domain-containing protein n=2 Tax=Dictyobacter vulcani TaxID=2607529 RepID=A0A5J4KXL9_9CHLR|nr:hypothetical protein KDW_64250 [Dictyobacter vulcani]
MVEVGRLARHDQGAREIIGELLRGSIYERLLGLQACFGSGDADPALQALNDASRSVRGLAGFIMARLGSDAQVLAGLETMALDAKVALLHDLDRRHRQAVMDAYIETLIARQDRHLKRLLPLASQDLVRRALPPLIDTFDLIDWKRLTRHHPEIAHAQIRSWIQTANRIPQDQRLLQVVGVVIPGLSKLAPDLALDLVHAMHTLVPLARLPLNTLITRRPREVADLVLDSHEASSISFLRVVRHLSTEQLLALFEHYPTRSIKTAWANSNRSNAWRFISSVGLAGALRRYYSPAYCGGAAD